MMKLSQHDRHISKRWYCFWLIVLCSIFVCSVAIAENAFTISIDALDPSNIQQEWYVTEYLTSQAPGVRITKYISDSADVVQTVRLSITLKGNNGDTLVYDRDFGNQSGTFDSGVLYLPTAEQNANLYLITLTTSSQTYAFPYVQSPPRLMHNSACSFGVRLMDLNAGLSNDWLMGTMVNLSTLQQQGVFTIPLCASNAYIVGQATLQSNGNQVLVNVAFDQNANVEVHSQSLYVITDCENANLSTQPVYSLGQWVDVGDATSALFYLPMTISYDAQSLSSYNYDWYSSDIQNQIALFDANRNNSTTPPMDSDAVNNDDTGEIVFDPWSEAVPYDDSVPLPTPPEGSEPMRTFTPLEGSY